MRRFMMRVLAILMVVWIDLLPPPTAAQGDYVEVMFRCGGPEGILSVDWKGNLSALYREAGKNHSYTLRFAGGSGAPLMRLVGISMADGRIVCSYEGGSFKARYSYDVHREIIGCSSSSAGFICKLKP